MRNSFFFLFFFISSLLFSQQRLVITHIDGTKDYVPVWQVNNISFEEVELPTPQQPATVNLGLKSGLLWGSWNVGAESEEQVGYLLGWGNADSTNLSKESKYFPLPNFTRNITNTDYDIAKAFWATEENPFWHMPTAEDFQELAECLWEWDAEKKAYKISNPEAEDESLRENYIYLPVTGVRFGEEKPDSIKLGFYWTGYKGGSDSTAVYVRLSIVDGELVVDEEDGTDDGGDGDDGETVVPSFFSLQDGFRARHMAVRPVYGEYMIPVTVSSSEAEQNNLKATIEVNIYGQGENVQYYIAYSNIENFNQAEADKAGEAIIAELNGTHHTFITLDNLKYGTNYYYKLIAVVGSSIVEEVNTHHFKTDEDNRIVDLGLGVKWARWNVGAYSEGEYGFLVPWGALSDGGACYNYWGNLSETEYDIAFVNSEWGNHNKGTWRIPTPDEFYELVKYCTITSDWVDGHFGLRFTRNGDSIFIPYCGSGSSSSRVNAGAGGFYWTSVGQNMNAEGVMLTASTLSDVIPNYDDFFTSRPISEGRGIRPVYGYYSKDNFIDNPDDPNPDDPNPDDPNPDDPNPDDPNPDDPNPDDPIAEDVVAVDLGLTSGTLWANMNVGASNPSEIGFYFSWAEVETKDNYSQKNYKYFINGDYDHTNPNGIKGIQGSDRDAAHVIWKGDWVMPTQNQCYELIDECNWTQTSYNNVDGYLVSSKKNSNSIFLPATGYRTSSYTTGTDIGWYWTSTLYLFPNNDYWDTSNALRLLSSGPVVSNLSRQYGMVIRPVKNK